MTRGAGDRWLAGQSVDGVDFAQHDPVEVTAGARAGARGQVLLLVALTPEPHYLVALDAGDHVRLGQSALRKEVGR